MFRFPLMFITVAVMATWFSLGRGVDGPPSVMRMIYFLLATLFILTLILGIAAPRRR